LGQLAAGNPYRMLVLTIDHAPGFRIDAILGDVVGATVRPDNAHIDEIVHTRREAVADLIERARQLGANAIVGLRFDHRTIAGRYSEICAYGTAMVLTRRRAIRRANPKHPYADATRTR
jgi:uncharacterized protein YbjQ (UPF0145 family)